MSAIRNLSAVLFLTLAGLAESQDGNNDSPSPRSQECCSRDIFGIAFGCVWALITMTTLIICLKRMRSNLAAAHLPSVLLGNSRLDSRNHSRALGLRTARRRFKIISKKSWESEEGNAKRNSGWHLASLQAASSAVDLLQLDIVLSPGTIATAELQDGWMMVTESKTSREAALSIRFSETPFSADDLRNSVAIQSSSSPSTPLSDACPHNPTSIVPAEIQPTIPQVLIMLPERIVYGHGVLGEVRINVYGEIVPWKLSKATSAFRSKVDTLLHELRSRRWGHHRNLWLLEPLIERKVTSLTVNRANVLQSSMEAINALDSAQLLKPFRIQFLGEDGSDLGGVRREWFQLMALELISPALEIFEPASDGSYQIASFFEPKRFERQMMCSAASAASLEKNVEAAIGKAIDSIEEPCCKSDLQEGSGGNYGKQRIISSSDMEKKVEILYFVGRFLAKCIIDQEEPETEDLAAADPEMYRSLRWILECNADEEMLGMTMSVDTVDCDGAHIEIDLVEGGHNIPVTEENKAEFVRRMVRWRLFDRVSVQTDALVAGFHSMIPMELLEQYTFQELALLLHGGEEVDLDDWRHNTLYKAGYGPETPVVLWFWDMLDRMSDDERLRVLKFSTGTGAIPPGGFADLRGPSDRSRCFSIVRISDTNRLPQAHTCFNELLLPEYETRETFDERWKVALEHLEDGMLLK